MGSGDAGPPFHPLAGAFPLLVGEDFDTLVEDIRANGQQLPIVVTPDGTVLDGRNRWLACVRLGKKPIAEVWDGPPETYQTLIISLNVVRRHLDKGRKAMALQTLANLVHGTNQYLSQKLSDDNELSGCQNLTSTPDEGDLGRRAMSLANGLRPGVSMAQLAKEHGVSRSYVANARRVQNHAPDLAQLVLSGEMKLWAALYEIKKRQDALEGHDGKPPAKPAKPKTKSKGDGKGGATDGGRKRGPAPPRPAPTRKPAGDPWSDVKAQLAAWLVNGSRILSMLRSCPDEEVVVAGQVEEHRKDIVELLRRVVPAPRNPALAGNGPALAAG